MTSLEDQSTNAIEQRRLALKNELRDMEDELKRRKVHSDETVVYQEKIRDPDGSDERASLIGNFDVTPRYKDLENPDATARSNRSKTSKAPSVASLVVTDEEHAEQMRHHFDYPEIHALCFLQIGMSLGYCAYTTTAWLYVGAVRHSLFPDCSKVWTEPLMRWTCETTVLAFWTYPIFCCLLLLSFYYRDLLCTRLYYEMLAHNVFLDFENVDFLQSSAVRLMLLWMVVAIGMYPMSGPTAFLTLTPYKMTIPYWLPLFSFLGLLYASWDLESRLLSLAKYVEREFDQAKDHMGNSVFMRDHLCEVAFEDVQKHALDSGKVHTTGSYISAIVKRASSLVAEVHESELAKRKQSRSILHSRFLVVFSSTYWISKLLYCPTLDDYRAKRFRKWFKLYKFYTYILLIFLMYLTIATVVTHLRHQQIINASWFTTAFNVEHFLIVPVGPKQCSFLLQTMGFSQHQVLKLCEMTAELVST